jgi:hypothetical protein
METKDNLLTIRFAVKFCINFINNLFIYWQCLSLQDRSKFCWILSEPQTMLFKSPTANKYLEMSNSSDMTLYLSFDVVKRILET